MFHPWRIEIARAADGVDGGAAPEAGADAEQAAPPKWFEAEAYDPETRDWLRAKGLDAEDPLTVLPKVVKGHRAAEQRIGKGLDAIMDRPAKDQPLPEWLRANAAALGLPETAEAYAVKPPESWPKDAAWDSDLEQRAAKIAFDAGVSPQTHAAYVGLMSEKMAALDQAAGAQLESAKVQMMQDLQRDFGDQMDAKIAQARQASQHFAQAAGIGADELKRVTAALARDVGDAGVIRMFSAIGAAMAEDSIVALNSGASLGLTPAEARAELANFEGPNGEYGKAFAKGDHMALKSLSARRTALAKAATAG